jgi:hypothetical protein
MFVVAFMCVSALVSCLTFLAPTEVVERSTDEDRLISGEILEFAIIVYFCFYDLCVVW